jgi:hypothetical protein
MSATAPSFRLVAYWGTRTQGERITILMHRAELQADYEAGTLSLRSGQQAGHTVPRVRGGCLHGPLSCSKRRARIT